MDLFKYIKEHGLYRYNAPYLCRTARYDIFRRLDLQMRPPYGTRASDRDLTRRHRHPLRYPEKSDRKAEISHFFQPPLFKQKESIRIVVTLKDSFDCTLPTDRKETQIFYRSQQKLKT